MAGYSNDSVGWLLGSCAERYNHLLCQPRRSALERNRLKPQVRNVGTSAREDLIAQGPWARSPLLARLEAVLFLAQEPLNSRKTAHLAGLADGTQARTLVRKLNALYDSGGWAFRVVEIAGGFRLMSRAAFAPWLRRLHQNSVEVRLSAPAMETLAVVAYRQPVLRADIEAVRGVQCGEILRQLMERDLVRIAGRSEDLGRPFLYGTTKRFLQVFGLKHLDDLPWPERFQPPQGVPVDGEEDPAHRSAAESDSGYHEAINNTQTMHQESNVKIEAFPQHSAEEVIVSAPTGHSAEVVADVQPLDQAEDDFDEEEVEDDDFDDDFDEDYDDLEDDEDFDDEDYEEDDEEEEEDDEGFEEDEWEEVDDEDEDEDEDEEEEEDDDEDDEEWDEDEDDEEDEEAEWEEDEEWEYEDEEDDEEEDDEE